MGPTVVPSLVGGALIGVAVAILLRAGQVAGVSGILAGSLRASEQDWSWRALFVAGLVLGGVVAHAFVPTALGEMTAPTGVLVVAGGLVGLGTRLGNGCTSGHGVCGMSRGSVRSVAATLTFMATAAAVVFLARHVTHG